MALLVPTTAGAQAVWTAVPDARVVSRADLRSYRVMRLDPAAFDRALRSATRDGEATTVPLPGADGGIRAVRVVEAPVLAPGLQARYPALRSFGARSGAGGLSGRLAVTPLGVTALLAGPDGDVVIEPVGVGLHVVFSPGDLRVTQDLAEALAHDLVGGDPEAGHDARSLRGIGDSLRTYRLAVAATGEFTRSRGGTVEAGLAGLVASVTRLNAIYERDLAVRFVLVEDNDALVFTDPETDPFESGTWLSEARQVIDAAVGQDGYDLGHVVSVEGTESYLGIASLGVACTDGRKAHGFSAVGTESTALDLLVLPHEVGHQLGAYHSFTTTDPGTGFGNATGVEPGVGYTLMGYPHFATDREPERRIGHHFHAATIGQIKLAERPDCGALDPTGNDVPVVTAPDEIVVPVSTPFVLEGHATDGSGTALTYAWDQVDIYGNGEGARPRFRSFDPGSVAGRSIPDLDRQLAGRPYPDETLPPRSETYTFRLLVRDNVPGGGALGVATTRVVVDDAGGPFRLLSQDHPVVYPPGASIEVRWETAGTEARAPTVDVETTSDRGGTWTVVIAGTANDGAAAFDAPDGPADSVWVRVRPVGEPFFALAQAPFAVGPAPTLQAPDAPIAVSVRTGDVVRLGFPIANGGGGAVLDYVATFESVARLGEAVGYATVDTDAPGGPAAGVEDLVGLSPLAFDDPDAGQARVALPFPFPFDGELARLAVVSPDGVVRLAGGDPVPAGGRRRAEPGNAPIPTEGGIDGFVAPFWDDLRLDAGSVAAGLLDDGRFAVLYDRVGRAEGEGAYTFAAVLAPDGDVEFRYGAMAGPVDSATVGVEHRDGLGGLQLAFDEPYVRSASAVRVTRRPVWARLGGGRGTLGAGESADVDLVFDATGLPGGAVVTAELVVRSNAPDAPTLTVPVTLTVTPHPVDGEDDPGDVRVSVIAPNPAASRAAFDVTLPTARPLRVAVYDALGREVAVLHDGWADGRVALEIPVDRLAGGVYLVRVVADGFAAGRRFVVAR